MEGSHRGLEETLSFPLMSALAMRRTRRVCAGTRILSGELSHLDPGPPRPLSALEEAILIASTGLTGITMKDGPLEAPHDDSELGFPFLHCLGRSAPSPDNSQCTHFFMINDEGIWFIRRLQGREGLDLLKSLPVSWAEWSESDWLAVARHVKVRISDRRLEFPRELPFYFAWNRQLSNVPGTTMFLPVIDTTTMYVNGLLNLMDHPDGQRPLLVDDWQPFHPRTFMERLVWVGSRIPGLDRVLPRLPYQIIGGLERARDPWHNPEIPVALGWLGPMLSHHEAYMLQQNLMLVAEAMGLASFTHVAVPAPWVWKRDESRGWHGIEMRMAPARKTWGHRPPPIPADQDNPVGIDGVIEGNCPPYARDMDEVVDRVLEKKHSPGGAYGDLDVFSRAYRRREHAETYLREGRPYAPKVVAYLKEVCRYIYDTYGRFPAAVDAMLHPGTWVQVGHLETGYYDRYFAPGQYSRQARHAEAWGET